MGRWKKSASVDIGGCAARRRDPQDPNSLATLGIVRVTVTNLMRRLGELLRLVERGRSADDELLQSLAARGIVAIARRPPDLTVLARPPVPVRGDAVRAVVEGRGER